MSLITDNAFDAALNYIKNNTENLYICNAQPTNFTEASSTYKIGTKASPSFTGPANGDASGRKVTVDAITDGTVNSSDTATHWALTDDSGTELLCWGTVTSQAIVTGSPFSLTAVDIEFPDPA